MRYAGRTVRVELALGLGHEGAMDLTTAREELPPVMGLLLLELMGLEPEEDDVGTPGSLHEASTPSHAFWSGFGAAREAVHAAKDPGLIQRLQGRIELTREERDRLRLYQLVPSNGFRFRFDEAGPTGQLLRPDEARRTAGVVATFFYRLLAHSDRFYPQREMLWFVSFDPEEVAYAKVLLAVQRMSAHKGTSLDAFVASYAETFPAEREFIEGLGGEVLAQTLLGDTRTGAAALPLRSASD